MHRTTSDEQETTSNRQHLGRPTGEFNEAGRERAESVFRCLADDFRRKAAEMERLAELSTMASPEQEVALYELAIRARTTLHRH